MPAQPAAQRFKRYRGKYQEEYRKKDVLRKRYKRMTMKTTASIANKERMRKERERKRAYRQRTKAEAS